MTNTKTNKNANTHRTKTNTKTNKNANTHRTKTNTKQIEMQILIAQRQIQKQCKKHKYSSHPTKTDTNKNANTYRTKTKTNTNKDTNTPS